MRLENWSMTSTGVEYDPPERLRILGNVYGHPVYPDGSMSPPRV